MAERVLLFGYGNPGRRDDGLGPALAAELEQRALTGLVVDSDYQLSVEDGYTVAAYDVVVFADAALAGPEPFAFRRLSPAGSSGLGSHGVEAGEVLALAATLFGARTRGYILGIRGYAFDEFGEGLSEGARRNLREAAGFIERVIRDATFDAEAGPAAETAGTAADEGERSRRN